MGENKIELFDILLLIVLGIPVFSNTIQYYFLLFIAAFFAIIICSQVKIKISSPLERIPIVFFIIWLIGVLVGITFGNRMQDIIRNFAGMSIYILYYFFSELHIEKDRIKYIIYAASIIATITVIITISLYRLNLTIPWPFNNIGFNIWTKSGVMSGISVLPFVLEAKSLWDIINHSKKKKIVNCILFVLATIAILFTTDSGGAKLGYIGIFLTLILIAPKANKRSAKYWIVSIGLLVLIIFGIIVFERKTGVIYDIFSIASSGNDKRYAQFDLVLRRFKLFGNGLGAEFDYYVEKTHITKMYGIEVSYLNLIDKFGVLSFFLLYYFIKSYLTPMVLIIKNQGDSTCNVICIGLLGYLFVAAGNPVLFSPYNVILHLLVIYLCSRNI